MWFVPRCYKQDSLRQRDSWQLPGYELGNTGIELRESLKMEKKKLGCEKKASCVLQ
jgi:hypothetical protein